MFQFTAVRKRWYLPRPSHYGEVTAGHTDGTSAHSLHKCPVPLGLKAPASRATHLNGTSLRVCLGQSSQSYQLEHKISWEQRTSESSHPGEVSPCSLNLSLLKCKRKALDRMTLRAPMLARNLLGSNSPGHPCCKAGYVCGAGNQARLLLP